MKDIMAGKTRANVKAEKLRGRAIVRGGAGTAARTTALFGGILNSLSEGFLVEDIETVHRARTALRKKLESNDGAPKIAP
jgi:hypothetical protein